jgi:hypothetical protein
MQNSTHLSHTELIFHFKKNNLFSYYLAQGFNDLIYQKNNDKHGIDLLNYAVAHEMKHLPTTSFSLEFIDKLFSPLNNLNMIHFSQVLGVLEQDSRKEVFQAITCNALMYATISEHFYYLDACLYLNRLHFLSKVGMLHSLSVMNQQIVQLLLEQSSIEFKSYDDYSYQDLFTDDDEDDVMRVATYYHAFEKCFHAYLNLQQKEEKIKLIEQELNSEINNNKNVILTTI